MIPARMAPPMELAPPRRTTAKRLKADFCERDGDARDAAKENTADHTDDGSNHPGDGVDGRCPDPQALDYLEVFCRRPHGEADLRILENEHENSDRDQGDHETDQGLRRHGDLTNFQRESGEDIVIGLVLSAPYQSHNPFENHREGYGHHDDRRDRVFPGGDE